MYALADCNNFYVSCERLFNPSLINKPVLVLSSNDGCVIARSNEVKALGIKMGQPFFQIRQLVEWNNITIFSTNFMLYGDISRRVMRILQEFAPSTEIYSIDEAFMDLSGIETEKLKQIGEDLALKVKRSTGIPLSIGVSPTKTLAKIASKLAKQYPKLNSCCLMYQKQDIEKVLSTYPIGDVWGIGRRSAKKLEAKGVLTALAFTRLPKEVVNREMGVVGVRTWYELQGTPCISFEDQPTDKKQISTSRSFATDIFDYEELHSSVIKFATMCTEKLRKQDCVCGEVRVYLNTNRFNENITQHFENRVIKLEEPTNSSILIAKAVSKGLKEIYRKETGYKKAGVILSDIDKSSNQLRSLFTQEESDKQSKLMGVLDIINKEHGRDTIYIASQSSEPIRLSREHLSQNFTTNWNEILVVKAQK